jgi:hypothetical protein
LARCTVAKFSAALLFALSSAVIDAQSISVYSEFTRVDPFGAVVKADRGADPREILSPALPRNAVTGFHIVLRARPGTEYTLHVGENPEKATLVQLYIERYSRVGDEWIPDRLEPVALPYQGVLATPGITLQSAQSFWMDVRVDSKAPVSRIKIEPEVSLPTGWIYYPMEARIVDTAAPVIASKFGVTTAALNSPSDMTARSVMKQKLCGFTENSPANSALYVRDFIARDVAQDMAMASAVPLDVLWQFTGAQDRAEWCRTALPHSKGPEWYLRVRDRIVGAHD